MKEIKTILIAEIDKAARTVNNLRNRVLADDIEPMTDAGLEGVLDDVRKILLALSGVMTAVATARGVE